MSTSWSINSSHQLGSTLFATSPLDCRYPSALSELHSCFIMCFVQTDIMLCSQTLWLSCFMQIVLLVTHISLLLIAKRAIICQDLGDHKDIRDQKDTRQLKTNPLNKCCRKIHKSFFSEHNRVRTATNLLTSRSFFLLCAVLSLWQPFLQSLILFDVVLILPRLGAFTQALMSAIPKVGTNSIYHWHVVSWH